MKRFLLLMLILLTACSTAEPVSYFDTVPEVVILRADSTSEQIQQAMMQSATKWMSLQMGGTITWFGADGSTQAFQERTWIDPSNNRFKVELNGVTNASDRIVKFSDGTAVYNLNLNSGLVESTSYPDSARVGQYVPPVTPGVAYPNPIWGQMGTPLSEMAFSSNFAQGGGTFKAVSLETVAGRETLIVEWTPPSQTQVAYKFWLDTRTAVILKMQEFGVKEGTGALQGERVVTEITYNQIFDAAIFTMPADFAQAVMPTQVGSQPIETGSTSAGEAGELYFFLMPRQAGTSIQLVKVSGLCVLDSNCPPMQIVTVPFPFNFTINTLSWSPDGKHAAFSYSDNPNGTPTKLWLFDPASGAWTSLAEFPYIDPPFWSPDGAWIAFRTQDGLGGEDVYVTRHDGSELKSVSTNLPAEGRPYIMDGWLGDNIIMRAALPGAGNTYPSYFVRVADGSVRSAFGSGADKSQFVAAPDTSLLAFDDYDSTSQSHVLKVMGTDGANELTLANFKGGNIYPIVWSPNSQWIAFNYYSGFTEGAPAAEVYVVSRDGRTLSSIYKGTTVGRLVFSPNGKYLLVEETTSASGGHLFLVNLSTLETKMLAAPGLSTDFDWYAPSWRP
jgi:dipeptidyl aminopeptidase/acylaminoacyl peptidase